MILICNCHVNWLSPGPLLHWQYQARLQMIKINQFLIKVHFFGFNNKKIKLNCNVSFYKILLKKYPNSNTVRTHYLHGSKEVRLSTTWMSL